MRVLPVILGAIAASILYAQAPPAFDAASIRPSFADPGSSRFRFAAGRLSAENCTLNSVIQSAYGLRNFQLIGGPAWIADGSGERFNIQAKADATTSDEELKVMAQTLLADRFHLKTHRETRLVAVYALVIAKGGPKLHPPKPDERFSLQSYPGNIEATNAPMSSFIEENSSKVDRPIIDKTALSGGFNFTLRWSPDIPGHPNSNLGSIFTEIQEQLGLKLDPQKMPVEVLVIDSIEHPSAN